MVFDSFQNDSGTLKLRERDANGTLSVSSTYAVGCDVQFKRKEVATRDGNKVTTSAMVFVTPTSALNAVSITNITNGNWAFDYESVEYQVETIERVRESDSAEISHYQILLR